MSKSSLKSFGVNAATRLYRTKFKHHDTADITLAPGWLVPVYCREIIPSDVWNMKEVDVSIKQALESAKPTFGDVYLSLYYFFIPHRILWKKFTEIYGKGQPSEWDNPSEVVLPRVTFAAARSSSADITYKSTSGGGYDAVVNSCVEVSTQNPPVVISERYNLADYLNFAWVEKDYSDNVNHNINILRFIAYEKVWTDWFRDENVQNSDPDVEKFYNYSGSGNLDVRLCLHYANKLKDVYTTCLPSPQKGDAVTVALGESAPIMMEATSAVIEQGAVALLPEESIGYNSSELPSKAPTFVFQSNTVPGYGQIYADLSQAVGATVNQVRFDFAMQKMKERDARGGTRFPEVMLSTFEAYNGDSTMQRPELLGGDTIQLNMTTVPSTGDNPGKLGGMSNTNVSTRPFVKTFGEPGFIMAVATIRPRNMYKQGIPKDALKYRRYNWYDPCLQNVGDQPVMKCELDAKAPSDSVFGFQEAWYEYKSDVNVVAGDMRGGTTDMDAWSYANEFSSLPYLNSDFKKQDGTAITKTLVGFLPNDYPGYVYTAHFDFRPEVTSPMMPHSIPGLIDHII